MGGEAVLVPDASDVRRMSHMAGLLGSAGIPFEPLWEAAGNGGGPQA